MATLYKIVDGRRVMKDGGARSEAIKWKPDGTRESTVSRRPTMGCSMLVGSVTARSYSNQDYWLTTEVSEILEDTEDMVRFKTVNGSTYEWVD